VTEEEFYKYFGYQVNIHDLKLYSESDIRFIVEEMYLHLKILGVDTQEIYNFIQEYCANDKEYIQ